MIHIRQIHDMIALKPVVILICSILLISLLFLSVIIPPFQSPDEFDHIKRAYLLTRGTIILDSSEVKSSGGMVDSGLLNYMDAYRPLAGKAGKKMTAEDAARTKPIKWTGEKKYSFAPGTGFYFPVLYTPQAIGLLIGETLGLTVDRSYRLARLCVLSAVTAILFAAFTIHNANPLIIALIFMPMSLFQFSSATLDGVSTALSIFAVSAFLRISKDKEDVHPWLYYALAISATLIIGCRVNLLPMLLLIFLSFRQIRNKKNFYIFLISVIAVFVWTAIAIKTTVNVKAPAGVPTSTAVLFYLKSPLKFIEILFNTLTSADKVSFYGVSFIGVLGWLDTPFPIETYYVFAVFLFLIGLLSLSPEGIRSDWKPRGALALCALGAILLIFFALSINWTPISAKVIEGVQGRYFMVPAVMIAYALSGGLKPNCLRKKIVILLVVLFCLFSILKTANILIVRYYLANAQSEKVACLIS